jgi:hypothetical protein
MAYGPIGVSARDEGRAETFGFFRGKWKRNENIKTKIEICGTEMETKFFWRK